MRTAIERAVPVGLGAHKTVSIRANACKKLQKQVEALFDKHPAFVGDKLPDLEVIWCCS